ncbi:hypothetical protein V6N13_107797 [Hibiscus sabdariffa]
MPRYRGGAEEVLQEIRRPCTRGLSEVFKWQTRATGKDSSEDNEDEISWETTQEQHDHDGEMFLRSSSTRDKTSGGTSSNQDVSEKKMFAQSYDCMCNMFIVPSREGKMTFDKSMGKVLYIPNNWLNFGGAIN